MKFVGLAPTYTDGIYRFWKFKLSLSDSKTKPQQQSLSFKLVSVIHCLQKFKHILNSTQKLYTSCLLSHFSCVWLFETLSTTTHQAPLSMGFSRQENWSGLPFPSPGENLPDPGFNPPSPALAGRFFTTGKPSMVSITY